MEPHRQGVFVFYFWPYRLWHLLLSVEDPDDGAAVALPCLVLRVHRAC